MYFYIITDNPKVAEYVDRLGVNRIFIDLETLGKYERQKGLNTLISTHKESNISSVKNRLTSAELLVRIDPFNDHSFAQIEKVIDYGADAIMLPMYSYANEVEQVGNFINGRAKLVPLVETPDAIRNIEQVSKLECVDDFHIGLNDLQIARGTSTMFDVFFDGVLDQIYSKAVKPVGFGGVANSLVGDLPASMILAEHVYRRSNGVILSRSFHGASKTIEDFIANDFESHFEAMKNELNKLHTDSRLVKTRRSNLREALGF